MKTKDSKSSGSKSSDDWVSERPIRKDQFIKIREYLGKSDALLEWTREDERETAVVFWPTISYKDFRSKDVTFLFGFRGAGKTTMMKMLQYQIDNHINYDPDNVYSFSTMINQEEAYNELANSIQLSPMSKLQLDGLVYYLKDEWNWIIIISVMQNIVELCYKKRIQLTREELKGIKKIEKYLIDNDLTDESCSRHKSPIKHIAKVLTEELSKVPTIPTQGAACALKIIERLFSENHRAAKEALLRIIISQPGICLVMIDSIESYNIGNKIYNAVALALIEATLDFYKDLMRNKILIKVAFPSEIIPHLIPSNMEKQIGRIVYIRWESQDLVSLMAKRYWNFVNRNYIVEKELEDYPTATNFLYRHLPCCIATSNSGIIYDTMEYIFRHTQKKPRQVVIVFNYILNIAARDLKRENPPEIITEIHIKKGVHAALNQLAKSSLNVYERMYPGIIACIRSIMSEKTQCMKHTELHKLLMKKFSACPSLSLEKKEQLLFECNILGLEINRILQANDKILIEGLFEYQSADRLPLAHNSVLVIHPMYYMFLGTKLNVNVSVCPANTEENSWFE